MDDYAWIDEMSWNRETGNEYGYIDGSVTFRDCKNRIRTLWT